MAHDGVAVGIAAADRARRQLDACAHPVDTA
jgi:hypothetical protein